MNFDVTWRPLEDVVDDIIDRRGVTPLKLGGDFTATGHRVISAKLIKDGRIKLDADEPRFVDETVYRKWMRTPLRRSDVIMTSEAPLGEVAYLNEDVDWVLGQRLFSIRPNSKLLDGRFLYYALQTEKVKADLHGRASGSTVQGIRQAELRRVQVPLPDLSAQRAASSVLGAIDDRITLLRETNTTLEGIAQALFKSWFVDFDPVQAKMQGRAPEGMDEATAALFPDSFEDSALGAVPKGWATISFRDSINVIGGGTPKTSVAEYWGGHIPWFSVVDAPSASDVFVVETEKHITEAGLNGSSTKLLPAGTTIISARGTVGRLALTGCPMTMNQSCYGLRGKAGDQYFTFFSTTRLVEQLKQRAHGSVFDTITQETFAGVSLAYPIPDVIAAFELLVDPLMLRIKANLMQVRSLSETRDTLLPRLISGQLRVEEAAEALA